MDTESWLAPTSTELAAEFVEQVSSDDRAGLLADVSSWLGVVRDWLANSWNGGHIAPELLLREIHRQLVEEIETEKPLSATTYDGRHIEWKEDGLFVATDEMDDSSICVDIDNIRVLAEGVRLSYEAMLDAVAILESYRLRQRRGLK